MSKKRERNVNFTGDESFILATLIEKYKTIIESKKSDADTWNKKQCGWKKIERDFNILSGFTYRNAKALKLKYEGMKREIRKKAIKIRDDMYHTEGSPNITADLSPAEEKISKILQLSDSIMESTYNSDSADPAADQQQPEIDPFESDKDELISDAEESTSDLMETPSEDPIIQPNQIVETQWNEAPHEIQVKKWAKWESTDSKSKKHPAFCNSRRIKPFGKLTEAKLELVRKQKYLLDEEMKHKNKQWAFEETERKWKLEMIALEKLNLFEDIENKKKERAFEEAERLHKKEIWALEKKALLKKING